MASTAGEIAIGIDLGTTYSCVGVWRRGAVEIIANAIGNKTTPSYVCFTENHRLVGEGARNQAAMNPMNTIYDAKRLIGRTYSDKVVQKDMEHWPFKVVQGLADRPMIVVQYRGEEKAFAAEEISSMILCQMRETAETYLDCTVKDAVITVPAYFNDSQRRATRDAGKIAGLNVMRIVNEPTAAALAYGLDSKECGDIRRKHVIIFDLGGGTFDVSLLMIEDGILEVKSISGDTHLGGEDFNSNMVRYFVEEFRRKHGKDITTSPRSLRRLNDACEKSKRILSHANNATLEIDALYEGIDFESKITRAKFESLNEELFKMCMGPLQQCLADANMDWSQIDELVLVGGSSRIPKVQNMLKDFFPGKRISNSVNPDEAVACGAAIQAAMITGDVQVLVLLDVTPLSLGVDTLGDIMSVVVPKNTPIPTSKEKSYTTCHDNQTTVRFEIHEGERKMASDNNLLGEFDLRGIVPAPAGKVSIPVVFQIDADGILKVSASESRSGQKGGITIINEKGRITEEEISRMVKEAERYKVEDDKKKMRAVAKNQLEKYAYDLRKKLRDETSIWGLRNDQRKTVENAILEALEWCEEQGIRTEAFEFDEMRMSLEKMWERSTS